jgi:hypothetical protein
VSVHRCASGASEETRVFAGSSFTDEDAAGAVGTGELLAIGGKIKTGDEVRVFLH